MKKTLILSAVSLSLLASSNVMAAQGLVRDSNRPEATLFEKILFLGDNNNYRTSRYTLNDLDNFRDKLRDHERELKQLQEENRNKDRQIDELKRSLQELNSKVKG
ncbi:hypothetical protein [Serratia proteamaculans]|uniref:hypothetical protein n=1 Tax=Serratia proteamaculans TaxID=28151 RepID=UPI002183DF18|nr:hypothetical protein [Serratia proteamaculans]CAI2523868.1 Uncharacterised protein [Serratia proteamaculans]